MARYATVGASAAIVYSLGAWTLADATQPHRSSLPRFLSVAVLGFLLNQILFSLLLKHTPLP